MLMPSKQNIILHIEEFVIRVNDANAQLPVELDALVFVHHDI